MRQTSAQMLFFNTPLIVCNLQSWLAAAMKRLQNHRIGFFGSDILS